MAAYKLLKCYAVIFDSVQIAIKLRILIPVFSSLLLNCVEEGDPAKDCLFKLRIDRFL